MTSAKSPGFSFPEKGLQKGWRELNQAVVNCDRCPRLRLYCQQVAEQKRKAYQSQQYWGRPVPNFVSPAAGRSSERPLMLVGLAPGAHGANRTGRMFTGDRSGQWLYRALHRAGFATQAIAEHLQDGLELQDCLITAACHCAPPDNRPAPEELVACSSYLERSLILGRPRVILALGKLGWDAAVRQIKQHAAVRSALEIRQWPPREGSRAVAFGHGQCWQLSDRCTLLGSYHPSQQNTFTGRLTESMLDEVMQTARDLVDQSSHGTRE